MNCLSMNKVKISSEYLNFVFFGNRSYTCLSINRLAVVILMQYELIGFLYNMSILSCDNIVRNINLSLEQTALKGKCHKKNNKF